MMMKKVFLLILLKHVCNRNKYTRSYSLFSKAKSAKARQPGGMPSPEKVRKSARVEENNEEEDQVFDAPNAQDEAV